MNYWHVLFYSLCLPVLPLTEFLDMMWTTLMKRLEETAKSKSAVLNEIF